MNLPPVDLSFLHERFRELATRVQDAPGFFAEGMEQMVIIDYPAPVREVVGRYFAACASPGRLH